MTNSNKLDAISRRAVLKNGAMVSGAVLVGASGSAAAQQGEQGTLELFDERPEPGDTFTLLSNEGLEDGNDRCRAGRTEEWITDWPGRWKDDEDDDGKAIAHLRVSNDFREGETVEVIQVGGECEAVDRANPTTQLIIVIE